MTVPRSMRVDEARHRWRLLAIKPNARTVVGRAEKSLLSAPESKLRLGREKEKEEREENRKDEQENESRRWCAG